MHLRILSRYLQHPASLLPHIPLCAIAEGRILVESKSGLRLLQYKHKVYAYACLLGHLLYGELSAGLLGRIRQRGKGFEQLFHRSTR